MNFWSYAASLRMIFSVLDFCAVYFMTLLGRCAFFSLPAIGLVLLLRTALRNTTFAKGAVWALMVPVLFLGKLALYYEKRAFLLFALWQSWCGGYWWVRYGYLAGVAISLVLLRRRRARLRRMLRGLPAAYVGGQRVYLCDLPVSPFTAGVFSPKIVLPLAAWERLGEHELQTIVLHERTHIRLGHLWCFLFWDVLCALLWVDPFLRLSAPKLKEDMEQICDAVTIRRGGQDAAAYGRVILKSLTLLRENAAYLPATFAGESDFSEAKRRILRVRDYRPYSRARAAILGVAAAACLVTVILAIRQASLPRYTDLTGFTVFRVDKDVDFVEVYSTEDDEQPPLKVTARDAVTVDNAALRAVLPDGSKEDACYYIMWGGFMKLPGIGGAIEAIYIDGMDEGAATMAGFSSLNDLLYVKLIKWM